MLGVNTRRDLLGGLALCLACGSAMPLGDGFAVEGVWTSGFGDEFTDIGGWEGVFVVGTTDQIRWYSYVNMSDPGAPVVVRREEGGASGGEFCFGYDQHEPIEVRNGYLNLQFTHACEYDSQLPPPIEVFWSYTISSLPGLGRVGEVDDFRISQNRPDIEGIVGDDTAATWRRAGNRVELHGLGDRSGESGELSVAMLTDAVLLDGDRLYLNQIVAGPTRVTTAYDLTDLAAPAQVYQQPGEWVDLVVDGIGYECGSTPGLVRVYGMDNGAGPTQLATIATADTVGESRCYVYGRDLYVAGGSGVEVFSVADPANPVRRGAYAGTAWNNALGFGDGLMYLIDAADRTRVLAVSVPRDAPCGVADLAPPAGVLDLADVQAFVAAFVAQDGLADLALPTGVFDLADLQTFVGAFNAGCP